MQNRLVPHPHVVDKNSEGLSRDQGVPALQAPSAQGSSARKINPQGFWLQKPVEIKSMEETAGFPGSCS